jgi:putative transposase
VRDRGNGLKTQPVVYRWTSRAGWVQTTPTSNEAIRMKTVNHKPINNPKTTPPPQGREEVRVYMRVVEDTVNKAIEILTHNA